MKSIRKTLGLFVVGIAATAGVAAVAPVLPAAGYATGPGGVVVYGPIIEGRVTQKFAQRGGGNEGGNDRIILIDGAPYLIDGYLYNQIHVGTVLRFDGLAWTIVSNRA